jgi:hypothetical protein
MPQRVEKWFGHEQKPDLINTPDLPLQGVENRVGHEQKPKNLINTPDPLP